MIEILERFEMKSTKLGNNDEFKHKQNIGTTLWKIGNHCNGHELQTGGVQNRTNSGIAK